jgi:hypothetical protein
MQLSRKFLPYFTQAQVSISKSQTDAKESQMSAAEQLIQHASETRVYETSYEYHGHISPNLNGLRKKYPEYSDQLEQCFQVLRKGTKKNPKYQFAARHVVVPGNSDMGPIEKELGIVLPDFFTEFYSRVKCGVMVLRNPISVFDAETILDFALLYQQIDLENGVPPEPIRILRFACVPPFPVCFAIRQSQRDGRWHVVYVSDTWTRDEIVDDTLWPEAEHESLDQWMSRLLETDGSPLVLGGKDYHPPLWRNDIVRLSRSDVRFTQ